MSEKKQNKIKIPLERIVKETALCLKNNNAHDFNNLNDSPRKNNGSWAKICIACIGEYDFKISHCIQKKWKENYGIIFFLNQFSK
jgi:hypothetical protein